MEYKSSWHVQAGHQLSFGRCTNHGSTMPIEIAAVTLAILAGGVTADIGRA